MRYELLVAEDLRAEIRVTSLQGILGTAALANSSRSVARRMVASDPRTARARLEELEYLKRIHGEDGYHASWLWGCADCYIVKLFATVLWQRECSWRGWFRGFQTGFVRVRSGLMALSYILCLIRRQCVHMRSGIQVVCSSKRCPYLYGKGDCEILWAWIDLDDSDDDFDDSYDGKAIGRQGGCKDLDLDFNLMTHNLTWWCSNYMLTIHTMLTIYYIQYTSIYYGIRNSFFSHFS